MSRRKRDRHDYFLNVDTIARRLSERYGDDTHGNKDNPLRELLFIICSVQTNEMLYRSTYTRLTTTFRNFRQLTYATEEEIAAVIARGGLARQKAHTIKGILSRLVFDFGIPTLRRLRELSDAECEEYLESLPGVGRKSARCVMMYSLGREVFPVDSNCWRICRRLGWVRPTRPDKSCSPNDMNRIQKRVPPELRFSLHVNFVSHGRDHCLPLQPKCDSCCIREYCRTGRRAELAAAKAE